MRSLRTLSLVGMVVSALVLQAQRHRALPSVEIPAQYAALYNQLSSSLIAAEAQVAPLHPELRPQPIYASELLPANGNRGTDLLQPQAIAGVRLVLDRFQQLGIHAVVIAVGYPLLLDSFPGSAQYLAFYQQVIAEVHRRGMVVELESSVLFTNSAFSTITWDYSTLTFSQFVQQRHDMIAKIVTQLAPDYLELGAEPDTEAKLTGYTQLNSPATWAQYITQIVTGINRGSTKIGTGLGSWESTAFADAEMQLPIDFLGLHIYPIDSGSVATAFQSASMAASRGKPVIIDEAWLYKMMQGETTSIAADTSIFARDAFDVFIPLDQQFLHFLDGFARAEGVVMISPFWATYFFGYLPYSPATASLPYSQIVAQVNAIAAANVQAGAFTPTGTYYGSLIAGRR